VIPETTYLNIGSLLFENLDQIDLAAAFEVFSRLLNRGANAGKTGTIAWAGVASTYVNWSMAGLATSVEGVSPAMVRLSPCVSEIVRPDGPLVA
jgi:hypothetical protein